jgi:hypothetical protein
MSGHLSFSGTFDEIKAGATLSTTLSSSATQGSELAADHKSDAEFVVFFANV